jgi:hypothetical protein
VYTKTHPLQQVLPNLFHNSNLHSRHIKPQHHSLLVSLVISHLLTALHLNLAWLLTYTHMGLFIHPDLVPMQSPHHLRTLRALLHLHMQACMHHKEPYHRA